MSSPAKPTNNARKRRHYWVYGLLVILFVFHHDLLFWGMSVPILGMPVGLAYDALYTILCAIAWWLMIRLNWPDELEEFADAGDAEGEENVE